MGCRLNPGESLRMALGLDAVLFRDLLFRIGVTLVFVGDVLRLVWCLRSLQLLDPQVMSDVFGAVLAVDALLNPVVMGVLLEFVVGLLLVDLVPAELGA